MLLLDLFAGCGGLSLGFKKKKSRIIGYVDWEKHCIETLKLNSDNQDDIFFIKDDIRHAFRSNNNEFEPLLRFTSQNKINGILGGPPCQAYSIAGRVRDPNNMKNDYRNYLFESYVEWLNCVRPDFFVFENVTGMLSANPDGPPIVELISRAFKDISFTIPDINKEIVFNLASFGGSQNRNRVIIFGVNQQKFKKPMDKVKKFYQILNAQFRSARTVFDAIGDLEKLYPLINKDKRSSHGISKTDSLHKCRFHNERDISIFKLLAKDQESNDPKYSDAKSIKKLYKKIVGKESNVHKYHVLKWNSQSNLIPAHLHKDGLRHIHPDPLQARSITMREAARLQNFPDDYLFESTQTNIFKMLGNAVSPLLAEKIAVAAEESFS